MSKSIKKELKIKLLYVLLDVLDVVQDNDEDFEYFEDRVNSSDEVYDVWEEMYEHFNEGKVVKLTWKYMEKMW